MKQGWRSMGKFSPNERAEKMPVPNGVKIIVL